jgi:MFS transporter, AAHS family, 3-hydroxyphenylpropionic acid transporter
MTVNRTSTTTMTVVLCVLAAVCEGVDLQAAGIAAAGVSGEFHPTPEQLGTFFSASTFGLFLGALVGGRLSDRLGRKATLIASVVVFGVCTLANALAWDIQSLVVTRFATGLGLGGALPNVLALVAESSAPNRRNFNIAAVYSGMPAGGALISLVSMALPVSQWRVIFVIGGLLPLMAAPLMLKFLRESLGAVKAQPTPSLGGATTLRAALSLPLIAQTVLLWAAFFLGLFTLYLLLNWLPTLMLGAGLQRSTVTIIQVGFNAGGVVTALIIGRLLESRWRRLAIVVTFLSLPLLIRALAAMPSEQAALILVVVALGSAVLAAQTYLYATAPLIYPKALRGLGVGVAVAIGRIGSFVGPKYGGIWTALGLGSSGVLSKLLPIAIAGSVLAIVLSWLPPVRSDLDD